MLDKLLGYLLLKVAELSAITCLVYVVWNFGIADYSGLKELNVTQALMFGLLIDVLFGMLNRVHEQTAR